MNKEIIKYDDLISNMSKSKKRNNKILFIGFIAFSLIPFFIVLLVEGKVNFTLLLFVPVFVILAFIYDKLTVMSMNRKIKKLEKYRDEINEYCTPINSYSLISTKYHIIFTGLENNFNAIPFSEISSVEDYTTDGSGTFANGGTYHNTAIQLTNGKKIVLGTSDKLHEILSKYYSKETQEIIKQDSHNSRNDSESSITSKVINDIYEDGEYYIGTFDFKYFNKECRVLFWKNDKLSDVEKAIQHLQLIDHSFIVEAIDGTISFYNDYLKVYGPIDNIPIRLNSENIMNYLEINEVHVSPYNNVDGFNLEFTCPWGSEERLVWTFEGKKCVYVGDAGDAGPWDDSYKNEKYNYAIQYRKKVVLTDEDYKRIANE